MFSIEIKPKAYKKILKLQKKSPIRYLILKKKVNEIVSDTKSYKNLGSELSGLQRVHIDKSFVLIFKIDKNLQIVTLIDFDHHDNIYKN